MSVRHPSRELAVVIVLVVSSAFALQLGADPDDPLPNDQAAGVVIPAPGGCETTKDLATATWQPLGDLDSDGDVDLDDFNAFAPCLNGPDVPVAPPCAPVDWDGDEDVDLADFALFQAAFTGPGSLSLDIEADADDGTEVDDTVWHEDGYEGCGRNLMGAGGGKSCDTGLRFHLPRVQQGESLVYARLVFPATGEGQVSSVAALRLIGVDQDSPADFQVARPSELPKTDACVDWHLTSNWPHQTEHLNCIPLHRYSPDISAIVNEILSRPGWGTGSEGKTLALVVENNGSANGNLLTFQDYREIEEVCVGTVSASLELYRTVRSTFLAKELLGCPTDHSVTVNALSLLTLEVYFEFGTTPGVYTEQAPTLTYPGGSPIEVVLDGLLPDARYYYRMRYRQPGAPVFAAGPEHTFHTQRPSGSTFTFTVQADSHVQNWSRVHDEDALELYRLTVRNALADNPDFHVDLGDTFSSEFCTGRDVLDLEEAVKRHLDQRPFLDLICHSAPFFFVLGNHEGEQGWRLDDTPDNVAIWATQARKQIYPLPAPDDFYTGSVDEVEFVGLRENYYAWEWGDALFVVLDPYWYTMTKPHGADGSGDRWDWTLGQEQYNWLRDTLESSSVTFKFVFCHHVTGGVNTYGRGGVEAASHALGGQGSYEWGGEDIDGNFVFDLMRPGWGNPIHTLMADNNVTIFFHGHDHVFVKQELDGVVYQECPIPTDRYYSHGSYIEALYYLNGDKVNNSGHIRVTVSPSQVTAEYIRAYLPGDGMNGEVAYSYTLPRA